MTKRRRRRSRRRGNAKRLSTVSPVASAKEVLPLRQPTLHQPPPRQSPSLVSRLAACIQIVEAVALLAAVLGLLATLEQLFDGTPL
jgi:hypothetical protein